MDEARLTVAELIQNQSIQFALICFLRNSVIFSIAHVYLDLSIDESHIGFAYTTSMYQLALYSRKEVLQHLRIRSQNL